MTRLFRIALATVLATLVLILFGSVTRLHTADAGCGNDWPRCNGQWLPALTSAGLIEYGHRALALSVLLLTVATVVTAFRTTADRRIRTLALASLGTLLLQIVIGGLSALWSAPTAIAILHLTAAMLFVASAVATLAAVAAAQGSPAWLADLGHGPSPAADRLLATVATLGAGIALLLLVFGASTSASGAFACATFPPCASDAGHAQQTAIHLGYRATALLGALATGATALLAFRRRASHTMRTLAGVAVALVGAQTMLNGLSSTIGDPAWLTSPQLLIASFLWLTMIGVALAAWRPQRAPTLPRTPTLALGTRHAGHHGTLATASGGATQSGVMAFATPLPAATLPTDLSPLLHLRQVVSDYVALTKPGIMSLLLTTTFCAMLIAQRGLPPFWLVIVTLLGGVLASGGAGVLNCYIDRDIDGQMSRTRNRAIVAGRVSARAALIYGITLSVAAVLLLGFLVNWTAAMLALAGNLFYVLIYTLLLKRSTPYNIVIGGAAGAAPPLVGWAAVTGDLSPLAIGLFLIIFMWTPPHFWALALLKQGEYTRASVPMLPVVKGEAETRRQIVIYTVLLTLVCLALQPFGLGAIYVAGALILNGIFLAYAIQLYRQPSKRIARQMFFYSLWYLAGIFAVAVIDRLLVM